MAVSFSATIRLLFRNRCLFRGKSPTFYHQILSTFFLEMIPTCSYFLIKSHISNLLRPMKFSLKQVKSGWSIVYIKGSKIIFLKKCLFLSVQTLMKCHIMWHFIWVFTVCHLKTQVPFLWFLVKKKHAKFSNIFLVCLICPICFCKQLMLVFSLCSKNN